MIAVITAVSGRHSHLQLQLDGLRAGRTQPDLHVVVSMGDPAIRDICANVAEVVDQPVDGDRLPVAAARNAGARRALSRGADVLVFLDVDCVPAAALVSRYAEVARHVAPTSLLSGPVAYLPPPPEGGYVLPSLPDLAGDAHPARPTPAEDEARPLDHRLFWSLSFALNAQVWSIIGGFCERYTGYGGEDTDFAQVARSRGVQHLAVGRAWAYHQWHPAPDPPLPHLEDILRNGRIFRDRWGWWPMAGWLQAFRDLGLVEHEASADDWTATGANNAERI
jgi:GT2 family glycosyltransferase